MANIASARKRARQSEHRRQHNAALRSELRSALETAGFRVTHQRGRRTFAIEFIARGIARMAQGGAPALGIHLLVGEAAKPMLNNVLTMMIEGILDPVELAPWLFKLCHSRGQFFCRQANTSITVLRANLFYKLLRRGDCQTRRKPHKDTGTVGWVVGWKTPEHAPQSLSALPACG